MKAITADYFTNKKNKVTFLLSVLVFFIHISTLANYTLNGTFGMLLSTFHDLMIVLAQVAVPMFFIISGIMFYKNYTPANTLEKYKSRFFSLVIPYLFWNTLWMIFDIVCSYTPISKFFIGRQKFELTFSNILAGIFLHTCTPFWFIFNLIIFVIFCPLFHYLLKNKIVGIVAILLIYTLSIFGIGLPESIFFSKESIIYYLTGAYIGKHFFNFFYNKTNKGIAISSIFVCIACYSLLCVNKYIFNINKILPLVMILFSFAIWYLYDLFKNESHYSYQKESFLIYAMHINVSAIFTKLVYIVLPKTSIFAAFNYIITILFTLFIICLFGIIVGKYLPKVKQIIAGR